MSILSKIRNTFSNSKKLNSSNDITTAIQSFLGNSSNLTEEDIMKIPAAQASIELITSSVGQLPLRLYRSDKENMPIEIENDDRLFVLNRETNETMNGYSFKKKIAKDYLLYGDSKSKIKYDSPTSNHVKSIYPLDSEDINIEVYTSDGVDRHGKVILSNNSGRYTFDNDNLLSILRDSNDGITGVGVLDNNSDVFRLALNQMNYESSLLKNNGTPQGVIEFSNPVTSQIMEQIRKGWDNNYGGPQNAGKTAILPDGGQYKQISTSPDKLQLDNSKKSTLSDIARVFNIPESLINSSANKYNSNEQNSMYFIQNCLGPLLIAIEKALDKSLLSLTEKKNNYYFRFDTDSLVNSTLQDTANATSTMYNNGIISLKEARRMVGYNNISDQDFIKFSQGNVLYNPDSKKMSILNKGETTDEDHIQTISTDNNDSLNDDSNEGNENDNGKESKES